MASLCKSQQCSIERRGFRQELDSWRYKLIHCVGFESILEGLFGPGLLKDLSLFEDCEPTSVCDWSFDENCLFCCVRREKVKEHLAGFHKPVCEAGQENLLKQDQAKIIRLERQAEEFINAVFYKKDSPRVFDPNIPLVAREIMQRMIRQFAAEYTSKTSSTQDSSHPNSTKNQSLPKLSSGKSSPPPATTQNPVLSKLLMADQDSPLDLTVKKSPSEEPCEQADGVLDLSTKKSPCSGSTSLSISQSTSNTIGNGMEHTGRIAIDGKNCTAVTLEKFMDKLCAHHQTQFTHVLNSLCTEKQLSSPEASTSSSDGKSNGCTCFVSKSNGLSVFGLHISDCQATPASTQQPVIAMTEPNCMDKVLHTHSPCEQYSPDLLKQSSMSDNMSVGSCITPANCASVHRIVYFKEQELTALSLEGDVVMSPKKPIIVNKNENVHDSAYTSDIHRAAEQANDPYEYDVKEYSESSLCNIFLSKAIDQVKDFQDHNTNSVPAEQKPVLNESMQTLKSTPAFEGGCHKACDVVKIGQPKSESNFENQKDLVCSQKPAMESARGCLVSEEFCEFSTISSLGKNSNGNELANCAIETSEAFSSPKCEIVSETSSVDVASFVPKETHVEINQFTTSQLTITDNPDYPSPTTQKACASETLLALVSPIPPKKETYAHCVLSDAENTANRPEGILTPTNTMGPAIDCVSSSLCVKGNSLFDTDCKSSLVSHAEGLLSPSVDVDIELCVEKKTMLTKYVKATDEQCPLNIVSKKHLSLEDSSELSSPRSTLFYLSNETDFTEQGHCPACQSHLRESEIMAHNETCFVLKNLKTEDVKSSSSSSICVDYWSDKSPTELPNLKFTRALNSFVKHSVNLDLDISVESVVKESRQTIGADSFLVEPSVKKFPSCSSEKFGNSNSLTPQHEIFKCSRQFNLCDINSVTTTVKDEYFNDLQTDHDQITLEIEEKASLDEVQKWHHASLLDLDNEVVENSLAASDISEEKISLTSELVNSDCSGIEKNVGIDSKQKSKRKPTLAPSDRQLRSQLFQKPPTLIPQMHAINNKSTKEVKTFVYTKNTNILTTDSINQDDLNVCKTLDKKNSNFEQNNLIQHSNGIKTKSKQIISESQFMKKEMSKAPLKTSWQKRNSYLGLRTKTAISNVQRKESANNANILEKNSTSDWKDLNKHVSRKTSMTSKRIQSKSVTKHKQLTLQNFNSGQITSYNNPKQTIKVEDIVGRNAVESEEHLIDSELNSPVLGIERPKFVDWCSEEDNQERISNFSNMYMSVHKTWIPLEKEAPVVHKSKNKSDKLKEIWKTKKRTRRNKKVHETPKYSSVQTLFMNSFKLSDVCRWFVETTETKSLVIVKKINTRLPEDPLPIMPVHKYPASSLYPHVPQAQRLKKYLKKFASVIPARNNRKTQMALANLKENQEVHLWDNLNDKNIVQGTNASRVVKSKSNVNKPMTDQKSQFKSGLVKSEKKEHVLNMVQSKITCSNQSITESSKLAFKVTTDSSSSESAVPEKTSKKRPTDPTGKSGTQVKKKKIMETSTYKKKTFDSKTNLPTKNINKVNKDSKSLYLKKHLTKRETFNASKDVALKNLRTRRQNCHTKTQAVNKHKMKTRQSKSENQKQLSPKLAKPKIKKALRSQRIEPCKNTIHVLNRGKKGVKYQQKKRKQRS
ncbi:ligand-dependent corepressor isoform X1 [Pelobates fuscus]|uniref:ligand-dependent corepressor isoform X1 n=2 Tax=Pelobates fuscus TaxID=191477 RepID=UPI002FE46ED5